MAGLNRRVFLGSSLGFAAASRASQAQGTPVRIGVLTDMTGLYSDSIGPGSVAAARMAADDAGGSVLGRPIEILAADNQNKADIGSAIARQWYDRDGVGMIVGLDNSAVALAVEQVAKERNAAVVVDRRQHERFHREVLHADGDVVELRQLCADPWRGAVAGGAWS